MEYPSKTVKASSIGEFEYFYILFSLTYYYYYYLLLLLLLLLLSFVLFLSLS